MTVIRFKLHPGASDEFKERLLGYFCEPTFWRFGVLIVKSNRTPHSILEDILEDGFELDDFVRIEITARSE